MRRHAASSSEDTQPPHVKMCARTARKNSKQAARPASQPQVHCQTQAAWAGGTCGRLRSCADATVSRRCGGAGGGGGVRRELAGGRIHRQPALRGAVKVQAAVRVVVVPRARVVVVACRTRGCHTGAVDARRGRRPEHSEDSCHSARAAVQNAHRQSAKWCCSLTWACRHFRHGMSPALRCTLVQQPGVPHAAQVGHSWAAHPRPHHTQSWPASCRRPSPRRPPARPPLPFQDRARGQGSALRRRAPSRPAPPPPPPRRQTPSAPSRSRRTWPARPAAHAARVARALLGA